ncbi:sulfate/molybdate ABC transporter ATP-binding protein [Heyndrickxia acidiproducens]|uniref:sulfate/molybdate ABC transporter ATP-binding protein n=1 Tax=Heyndrickxia acidiproducens TaxID=1121084 RepID=UPI00037B4D76|nr:ABC transporter ATP-binding protein [Heyndrickxia acidiproducens]
MLQIKIKKAFPQFYLDVDFSVHPGITGILGPSGSGKSLTLQCIAGLENPDAGSIRVNGRVVYDAGKKINIKTRFRKTGYLFQHYALFPHLTVKQNIAYGLKGMPKKEREERVRRFLEKIQLQGYGNRYPNEMSGGQQQRVALARTLIPEPACLLLDEPFSALDDETKQFLMQQFATFIHENFRGAVLFVTHSLEEAVKLCDHLVLYKDGKVLQTGPKNEVLYHPETKEAARIAGCSNILEISRAENRICMAGGAAIAVDGKKAGPYRFLGIHAHHVKFTNQAQENVFSYRVTDCRQTFDGYHVTAETPYFTVCASVPPDQIQAVLAVEKKLYLPKEHLLRLK